MFKRLTQLFLGEPQGFVSEPDQFLISYRQKKARWSLSQQKEIAKAKCITSLRDDKHAVPAASTVWKNF